MVPNGPPAMKKIANATALAMAHTPTATETMRLSAFVSKAHINVPNSVGLAQRSQESVRERNVCGVSKLPLAARVSCAFVLVLIGLLILPAGVQAKVNGGCTGTSTSGAAGPYRIADYYPYSRVLAVAGTSTSCDGSVLIIVDDVSPLTTWAGVLGLIAALLGLIGLLATLTQVPTGNIRIVGMVVGVVAGLGVGLLLQEMAILDPANPLGLLFPGGGAVLGFLVPGLLRSQTLPSPQ